MQRRLLLCMLCAAMLLLSGCRSIFEAEYVAESDYVPPRAAAEAEHKADLINDLDELRQVLRDMVAQGETQRRLFFAPNYDGDLSADLAAACWQVRTQDALCAYCVESISYDVGRVVSVNETTVSVSYSAAADDVEDIVRLPYGADARSPLYEAMENGREQLVLLIERSSYTEEDMAQYARQVYREHPAIAPQEPSVEVIMFSGAETQRLYEFTFNYGMTAEEFASRKAELLAATPFAEPDVSAYSETERAVMACSYLCRRVTLREKPSRASIYDALVLGEADSIGLAYAFTDLCEILGLPCQVVSGQRNWEEHTWNIVELDGKCYHVDVAACIESGPAVGFLLNDEMAWDRYRWDYFSYPHCEGALRFSDVAAIWDELGAQE